ncbi:MAG TPA: hypothetical protein VFR99_11510 [Marmoricola sp.]|nr:hypothetical protein [Marmoricola sp.]
MISVLWLVVVIIAALLLSGVVMAYVAYPHRGEELPHAPWLGEAMKRGVQSLPTLTNERARAGRQR